MPISITLCVFSFIIVRLRPRSTLFPYTTLFRSIDIMGLQAAYANLHTDQERDYFMQRYHDVISSFGGKTSYDADNRPLLVMRSNLWASGYDVDGTDETSSGQFSGRVQQTYKHSVPDRKSGSAGMPSPIAYAVCCETKKDDNYWTHSLLAASKHNAAAAPVAYAL